MDPIRLKERRWLGLIFGLYLFTAAAYSLLMPMWEGPDEGAHYVIILNLVRARIYSGLQYSYEAYQPRGYYYLATLPILALERINPALNDFFVPDADYQNILHPVRVYKWTRENFRFLLGPYILRWLNILLGGLALGLNWLTYRLIVPDKPALRLAALALAALTPQYLHIMSSIANDALGTLAGALIFYLAIRMTSGIQAIPAALAIILAVILPLTTKLTALPLGITLLITLGRQIAGQLNNNGKRLLLIGPSVLLASLLILFLLSPETLQSTQAQVVWRLFTVLPDAWTLPYLKTMLSQVIWSYWGKVGWLAVGLPVWSVNLLTALGIIGMSINAFLLLKMHFPAARLSPWGVTWLAALISIAAVLKNGLNTDVSQGRFLFPAIGALALLMVSGWHDIIPDRLRTNFPIIVMILMMGSTLLLWDFGIIPVYLQPLLN
jgi:hypothetical protein